MWRVGRLPSLGMSYCWVFVVSGCLPFGLTAVVLHFPGSGRPFVLGCSSPHRRLHLERRLLRVLGMFCVEGSERLPSLGLSSCWVLVGFLLLLAVLHSA